MPHGVNNDFLTNIANGWGQLKFFEYGRHKMVLHVRNFYLHLKLAEINLSNILDRITVNHHYVAVIKPGENITLRCRFCKLKGHKIVDCPEKQRPPTAPNKNQRANLSRKD